MTLGQRVLALTEQGFNFPSIAAIFGITPEQVEEAWAGLEPTPPREVEYEWLPLHQPLYGIAADAGHVYYVFHGGPDAIGRSRLDGSGLLPTWITSAEINDIVVDATHIYWTSTEEPSAIGRAKLDGTGVEPEWVKLASYPRTITVGGGWIYFSAGTTHIGRVKTDGSGLNEAWRAVGVADLTTDGTHLYWADEEEARIGRARLDGSEAVASWLVQKTASLTSDGQYLYLGAEALAGGLNIARVRVDGSRFDATWRRGFGSSMSRLAYAGGYLYAMNSTWLDRILVT